MIDFGQILCRPFRKAWPTANRASGAFATMANTKTRPSGDGIVDLTQGTPDGQVPQRCAIMVYGLGSDNDAVPMRITAFNRISVPGTLEPLYVERSILQVTTVLSAYVGVANTPVLNTERFADTIALVATVGEARITADVTNAGTTEIFSPANNTPAWVVFWTRGAELLKIEFDSPTVGTPTMNALVQLY